MSFAIGKESFEFWKERLRANGVNAEETEPIFGERRLRLFDPDGVLLQLVARDDVPDDHRIQIFAAPTLQVRHSDATEKLLTEILGFRFVTEGKNHRRFAGGRTSTASIIDLASTGKPAGDIAVGSVHHIAFRAADEAEQLRLREQLIESGFAVSPVMDRNYFHSIYFREPSGILFEVATDGPGFTVDEPAEALGQSLQLPASLEPMRVEIERVLPPLEAAAAI